MREKYHKIFAKGGLLMLVINSVFGFIDNGARTFREAAMGQYRHESEAIQRLREEMLGDVNSDAQNLRRDRMMVGRDVRTSFNKIVAEHGKTAD